MYDVSTLPAYVEANHDLLVKNIALIGDPKGTRSRISIQTGVKGTGQVNVMDLDLLLTSGQGCGFDPVGSATLSARPLPTEQLQAQMAFCEKTLLGKYAEYLVKVNAIDNPFPFEEYITDALAVEINKNIERRIWTSDKEEDDAIDGFVAIAKNDGATNLGDIDGAYAAIKAVYEALPEEVLAKGAEIYVSPANFRAFMMEMVEKNYFHYNPGNEEYGEYLLPGTDCKVVRTQGLTGSEDILGTFPKNLVYGCDMQNDEEKFDVWFSKDRREWCVDVEWNGGVQIAFPDLVVIAKNHASEG